MLPGWVLALVLAAPLTAEVVVVGRVTNDNNAPIAAARVSVSEPDGTRSTMVTDPTGAFKSSFSKAGDYRFSAERDGFYKVTDHRVSLSEGRNEVQLVLNPVRDEFQSVDVVEARSGVDMDSTASEQTVSGADMLAVPFPNTHNVKSGLNIMPGMVQDAAGGVHYNGGAEEQVLFTLNGFTLNDPLTGRFESRMTPESIQSLDTTSGKLSAEYGRGVAGMLAITSTPGDDKLRYTATNFVPGVESHKGLTIGDWTPRAGISGPIKKGRAWFSDTFTSQYIQHFIDDLPKGADRTSSIRYGNLFSSQVNLTPRQILYSGLLLNTWSAPRSGLGSLDPIQTTVDRRSRQWFYYIKDQLYFQKGAFVEFGYAANRTFGREIPQGPGDLLLLPDGKLGNSNVDATRTGARDEFLSNVYFPVWKWLGTHQVKAGVDVNRVHYWQDVRRSGIEQYRVDGSLARRVEYLGSGLLNSTNVEAATYVQDSWRLSPTLLIESGLRLDWDRILKNWNPGPRVGASWAPFGMRKTRLSGGFAIIYESTNLRLFTRPLDQSSVTTYFNPDGTISAGPAVTMFTYGRTGLRTPYSINWNAGVDRDLADNIHLRIAYLQRRGREGFTYFTSAPPGANQIYTLGNRRRDSYDSVEVTLRQTFGQQYTWLVSYVRSRARSTAVADITIEDPFVVSDNTGPLPWDAPNRVVSWGRAPTPFRNWAIPWLLEWRTGFPFSTYTDQGFYVGPPNARRLPDYFSLNLHVERRFVFHKHRWELRAGFNNITSHYNPNSVNADVNAPTFLRFYDSQHRTAQVRIRWLGRESR